MSKKLEAAAEELSEALSAFLLAAVEAATGGTPAATAKPAKPAKPAKVEEPEDPEDEPADDEPAPPARKAGTAKPAAKGKKAKPAEDEGVSFDELQKAFRDVVAAHGNRAAAKLLKQFEASKLSDLDEEDYPAALAAAQEKLSEEEEE